MNMKTNPSPEAAVALLNGSLLEHVPDSVGPIFNMRELARRNRTLRS